MKSILAALILWPPLLWAGTQQVTAAVEFTAPDGTQAAIVLARSNISLTSTAIWHTTLYYSFCLKPHVPSCLNGYGTVPNSAFKGNVSGTYDTLNILTVQIDTSKLPGYVNQLCYDPDSDPSATCLGGSSAATGGVISLTLTKTPNLMQWQQTQGKQMQFGTWTQTANTQGTYSATPQGTVIGQGVAGYDLMHSSMGFVAGSFTQQSGVTSSLSTKASSVMVKLGAK